MNQANSYGWYSTLVKPSWAPPAWLFGPVWSVLYVLIALSYGYVGYLFFQKQVSFIVVLPFLLNLIFNLAFTPIQFGLKNNYLAALDVLLVLATLIWSVIAIYPHARWVTYANLPYLAWVCFATVLQLTVTYLNL
jgi:tryptophan-rich sensory protein